MEIRLLLQVVSAPRMPYLAMSPRRQILIGSSQKRPLVVYRLQSVGLQACPFPWAPHVPVDEDDSSSSEPSSTKHPSGQRMKDDPPTQGNCTDSQMQGDSGQPHTEFRGRFHLIPFALPEATGTAPYVATPRDVGGLARL